MTVHSSRAAVYLCDPCKVYSATIVITEMTPLGLQSMTQIGLAQIPTVVYRSYFAAAAHSHKPAPRTVATSAQQLNSLHSIWIHWQYRLQDCLAHRLPVHSSANSSSSREQARDQHKRMRCSTNSTSHPRDSAETVRTFDINNISDEQLAAATSSFVNTELLNISFEDATAAGHEQHISTTSSSSASRSTDSAGTACNSSSTAFQTPAAKSPAPLSFAPLLSSTPRKPSKVIGIKPRIASPERTLARSSAAAIGRGAPSPRSR
jgi:hypothetical protein